MAGKVSRFLPLLVCMFLCCGFHFTRSIKRETQTYRPIIGIMAQSSLNMTFQNRCKIYIPGSYVKFIESSGARVVPIFNNLTKHETKKIFESINGAIFPGGIVKLTNSGYANVAKTIFNLAMKKFDEGGYFPIMGVCLGHQLLPTLVAGLPEIRIPTDSLNLTRPLRLPYNYRESKLFREIPEDFAKEINQTLITAHFHERGLPVNLFRENRKLKDFFDVITTNFDRNGVEFVSTMEAKKYPFYSTQWHPEKYAFEWCTNKDIPHSSQAIQLSQYLSNFFVQEARYSKHKFPSVREERASLLNNYISWFAGINETSMFNELYLFD